MEAEFLTWLRARLAQDSRVPLGLSSDAAIIRGLTGSGCIATTDTLTEGVDFSLASDAPRRIGRKSLAVNLSDLAAMASRPVAALVSLVLPQQGALELAMELFKGILPLAQEFDLVIAGGDTNTWSGGLVISVTALGEIPPHATWHRGGARPGDAILVTGQFGGSRLGKQFDFTPRVREAQLLAQSATIRAATDVSDGLSLDLSHILTESGCGAELWLERIPVAAAAVDYSRQVADGRSPLEHALGDGEDFELILVAAAEEAQRLVATQPLNVPLTCIGRCIEQPGLWNVDAAGNRQAMTPRGWQH